MIGALCVVALTTRTSLAESVYEAKSEITFDVRPPKGYMVNYSDYYEEVVNTHIPCWRSDAVFTKILDIYRSNYPNSTVTDKEILEVLAGSELKRVPHARLIEIAVRSKTPEFAAALANAYAQAIESFTDEENKKRCDKAVAQVHAQVMKHKEEDDKLAKKLLDFRTKNKIDSLEAQRAIFNQSLSTTTANVLEYEKRVMAAKEWVRLLKTVRSTPEKIGELPTGIPQSSEIAAAYTKLLNVKAELDSVKTWASSEHPKFLALEKKYKVADGEFKDTVERACKMAQSDLAYNEGLLEQFKQKSNELKKSIGDIGLQIVEADVTLKMLNQEKKVSSEIYQDLLQKENEQRIAAEQGCILVRVGRPATVPTRPVNRSVW